MVLLVFFFQTPQEGTHAKVILSPLFDEFGLFCTTDASIVFVNVLKEQSERKSHSLPFYVRVPVSIFTSVSHSL